MQLSFNLLEVNNEKREVRSLVVTWLRICSFILKFYIMLN